MSSSQTSFGGGAPLPQASSRRLPTPPVSQVHKRKRSSEGDGVHVHDKRRAACPGAMPGLGSHYGQTPSGACHVSRNTDAWDASSDMFNDTDLDQELRASEAYTASFGQMAVEEPLDEALFLADVDWDEVLEPPPSVLMGIDGASVSADEYDSNMQHSSPDSGSALPEGAARRPPSLADEADWETVRQGLCERPAAQGPGAEKATPRHDYGDRHQQEHAPLTMPEMRLRPYKTFFHVQEMLDAKTAMYKNQPQAVFELFARVIYSARENFERRQYFQFRDLFKETPPYLSGALVG